MKFGLCYEHQIPRPWDANLEHRIYRDEALEQVGLAQRIGIACEGDAWRRSLADDVAEGQPAPTEVASEAKAVEPPQPK